MRGARVVAQVGEEVGAGGVVRERVVRLVRVLVAELSKVGGHFADATPAAVESRGRD